MTHFHVCEACRQVWAHDRWPGLSTQENATYHRCPTCGAGPYRFAYETRRDAETVRKLLGEMEADPSSFLLSEQSNSRGDAELRGTGYLESTDSPGPRSTLTEKGAAPPGRSSDGVRQRRNAAASHVQDPARDALRASAAPREPVSIVEGRTIAS